MFQFLIQSIPDSRLNNFLNPIIIKIVNHYKFPVKFEIIISREIVFNSLISKPYLSLNLSKCFELQILYHNQAIA